MTVDVTPAVHRPPIISHSFVPPHLPPHTQGNIRLLLPLRSSAITNCSGAITNCSGAINNYSGAQPGCSNQHGPEHNPIDVVPLAGGGIGVIARAGWWVAAGLQCRNSLAQLRCASHKQGVVSSYSCVDLLQNLAVRAWGKSPRGQWTDDMNDRD